MNIFNKLFLSGLSMLMIGQIACGMEVAPIAKSSRLLLINKTTYAADITEPKIGKLGPGGIHVFDDVPQLITFKTYGLVREKVAMEKNIFLNKELLQRNIKSVAENQDIILTLELKTRVFLPEAVTPWTWDVKVVQKEESQKYLAEIPSTGNPWDVFSDLNYKVKEKNVSSINYAWSLEPKELARNVLGLKIKPTKDEINYAYNYLVKQWGKDDEFSKEVRKVAERAQQVLTGAKANFYDLLFKADQNAQLLVNSGKELVCSLYKNNNPLIMSNCLKDGKLSEDGKDYLKKIVSLMWYLFEIAVNKNQGFIQGTFVVQDPGFIIYDSLINYVKCVNKDVLDIYSDKSDVYSKVPYGYARYSDHFVLEQENIQVRHYGIDTIESDWFQDKLPVNKTHILFGHLTADEKNHRIMIKLEDYGRYPESVIRKYLIKPSKMIIPTFLMTATTKVGDLIKSYLATEDNQNFRKERISQDFIKKCSAFLNTTMVVDTYTGTEKNPAEVAKQYILYKLSTGGIQFLYKLVNERDGLEVAIKNAVLHLSPAQEDQFKSYLGQLEKEFDHIDIRYGREVIITHDDLVKGCTK